VRFEFFPLRFEFVARESLFFPPGKAPNILRGALGTIFRAQGPESRAYDRVFAPVAGGGGPSGLADPPRPFVFRARHLDGFTVPPGQLFSFDLNLFSLEHAAIAQFVSAFSALGREGLGPRRGKADLLRVRRLAVGNAAEQIVTDGPVDPVSLNLAMQAGAPRKVRVEFLTPTELKHEHRVIERPEFPILFGRIRDRISTLRALYGPGPLDVDFRASGERAEAVPMTRWEGRRIEVERHSSRTGQTHPIGGFIGVAEYEGDLAEFLPYLEAARWTGVGRQTVWGKGEIAISDCSDTIPASRACPAQT
jgi:hypothetical protein